MSIKGLIVSLLLAIFASLKICTGNTKISEKLVMVHALFRHGDRTPETIGRYPNDPYKNKDYFPLGSGALTNKGKRREYSLGKSLRLRYNKFLGDVYTPELLDARSTDVTRAQMSLLLVLAALFPPKGKQKWDSSQNWQPIPYSYESNKTDKVLAFLYACPNFVIFVKEHMESERGQKINTKYIDIFKYIAANSGWNSTDLYQAFLLYYTLETEYEMGLELPEWTSKIYPEPLYQIASEAYEVLAGTIKLRQIGAGYLLKKILRDTLAKIKYQQQKKLYLYSGHEINVALMLNTLGVFKPHVPPYGSCILFEVHNVNNEYGFKIFYENYQDIQAGLLKIPGCEEFCPLDKFISLLEKYFPEGNVCGSKQNV